MAKAPKKREGIAIRREGFWRLRERMTTSKLPWPVRHSWQREENRERIAEGLNHIQQEVAELHRTRGDEECRLCHRHLDATEFRLGGLIWPRHYLHYIEYHGICPSEAFRKMIKKYRYSYGKRAA